MNKKKVTLFEIYSVKLISVLDGAPHYVAFSNSHECLEDIINSNLMENPYKVDGYKFELFYKEGTPFQWYYPPTEESINNRLAGIESSWVSEDDYNSIKNNLNWYE